MSSKLIIILNPQAKRGRAPRLCAPLIEAVPGIEVQETAGPDDATRLAGLAVKKGFKTVIAAGGDGTLNEVLNGIVGSDASLGILPLGSVNVLARQLKIPLSLKRAWEVIERGSVKSFDIVKVEHTLNDETKIRYFIQLAGAGLDARVIQRVTTQKKKKWGPLSYVIELFRCIQQPLPEILVKVHGLTAAKGSFILLGNGNYYAGPFNFFPKASLTDGLLDLCVFQDTGLLKTMKYLTVILFKRKLQARGIQYLQERSFEAVSDGTVPFELDGEFAGFLPARFTVIPEGLKILVP